MALDFTQAWSVAEPGAPGQHAFWGLDADDEAPVIAALLAGDDPASAPDSPWAAAVVRPDGSLVAAASTTFPGGLYWSWDAEGAGRRLLIAVNPAPVIAARHEPTTLDEGYVRDFVLMQPSGEGSAYREIRRIPAGATAVWDEGRQEPRLVWWFGPAAWPAEPDVQGPGTVERYVDTFDRAVDALTDPGRPLAATLSGGLDSTFMVASLARFATAENPIHAFCHSPHPDALPEARPGWLADDFPDAQAMAARYAGKVVLHRVVNAHRVLALDAAADVAARSWLPPTNPGNQAWLDSISRSAGALGADRVHVGAHGNAAFSVTPTYALRYYLSRGDWSGARGCLAAAREWGDSWPRVVRRTLLPPLVPDVVREWRSGAAATPAHYAASLGVADPLPALPQSSGRALHLRLLAGGTGLASVLGPVPGRPLWVDPFTDRQVTALAASITPLEWLRGPAHRGFARRAGAGRVPDQIRLRTARGVQAGDMWWAMSDQRDRYQAEVDAISSTPGIAGWIDDSVLRERISSWQWGTPSSPPAHEIAATDKVLSIAAFVRMTTARLAALASSNRSQESGT